MHIEFLASRSGVGPARRVVPANPAGHSVNHRVVGRSVHPRRARGWAASLAVLLALSGWGCGSSAPPAGHSAPIATPPPPITTDRGEVFNVTITSQSGQILVDKLEVEFNRRRGIHDVFGFYLDNYTEMARIPFARIKRIEFRGQMPETAFEQAIVGREDQNLLLQNAFEVQMTYWDGNRESFYAIIPMFRGEKDLNLWEFPMDSRSNQILYLEFNR